MVGIILVNFSIALIILAILAVMLKRDWWTDQQKPTPDNEQASTRAGGTAIVARMAQWRARLRNLRQPTQAAAPLSQRFREWARQELSDERALQSWLLALPEGGFALLTEHIAAFCQEMNFDLQWLLAEPATVAPELKAVIRSVVIDYCHACQKAAMAQKDAKLFIKYQQLLKNPTGKPEQALQRTIYANLVSQGVTPTPQAADLINVDEKERQQQMRQAIQQAATNDWPRFAQVLHAAIAPENAASTQGNGQHNGKAG